MIINGPSFLKLQAVRYCPVICVSFRNIRMACRKMTSHEADRRIEEIQSDPYSPLVAAKAL
jgi:hypothetical protein